MGHKLLLEVPEDVYKTLVKIGGKRGQPPEDLAVQWLINSTRAYEDDPLEKFIGAFRSDIPDWADEHDKYIGESLMRDLRGDTGEEDDQA